MAEDVLLRSESQLWVIIVTYNGARWIERCLDSLPGADYARIVVVDNASRDDTRQIVSSRFPHVELIALGANEGFGHANNIAIQHALAAGAKYICLANQDLVFCDGALPTLCAALEHDGTLGLVSALQLNYEGTAVDPCFRWYLPRTYWDDVVISTPKSVYAVEFVGAAAVVIRREALLDVGGFDPLFFMYAEDNDLCTRLLKAGWSIGIAPGARVRHDHGLVKAPRSLKWYLNQEYSHGILYLKHSRHPLLIAYAGLAGRWCQVTHPSIMWARLVALARCSLAFRALHERRTGWSHRFAVSAGQGSARSGGARARLVELH